MYGALPRVGAKVIDQFESPLQVTSCFDECKSIVGQVEPEQEDKDAMSFIVKEPPALSVTCAGKDVGAATVVPVAYCT